MIDRLLLEAVKRYVDWHGPCHEDECPGDDTCSCKGKPINDAINAAIANADFKIVRAVTEAVAETLCYCCHHKRGECPHCKPWQTGLHKLMDACRGNAMPSTVCQCNRKK